MLLLWSLLLFAWNIKIEFRLIIYSLDEKYCGNTYDYLSSIEEIFSTRHIFIFCCCLLSIFFLDLFQIHAHIRILAHYSLRGIFNTPAELHVLPSELSALQCCWFLIWQDGGRMKKKTARNDGFQVNIWKFSVINIIMYVIHYFKESFNDAPDG